MFFAICKLLVSQIAAAQLQLQKSFLVEPLFSILHISTQATGASGEYIKVKKDLMFGGSFYFRNIFKMKHLKLSYLLMTVIPPRLFHSQNESWNEFDI